MQNTPEQNALVEAITSSSSNLMVQAYAGTGKTTSLIMMAQHLPAIPSLALAFNAKIKKELETKFPKHFECKTLNGLGHGAWSKTIHKRLIVDDKKLGNLVTQAFKELDYKGSSEDWDFVRRLVSLAMQSGLVPSGMAGRSLIPDTMDSWEELGWSLAGEADQTLIEIAQGVLRQSIKLSIAGTISFDDQIYMSALFGGVFQKYGVVMVDEAQDLSPLNHIQLSKVSPPSGRLIVVGDRFQSIYGFRGADTNSMDNIRKIKTDWVDLKLSLTFRCPKVVVARQGHHVPAFQAFHTNADGHFHRMKRPEGHGPNEPFWSWKDIQTLRDAHECHSVAIVCRNNAPLISTAFRLLRQGIGVVMLGRDIGKSLTTLIKKIVPDEQTKAADCVTAIQEWMDREVSLARANQKDDKADAALDKGESLLAVIDSGQNIHIQRDIVRRLEEIFSVSYGLVTLSTIHKVKGLEYDLVIYLDPWRIPSRRALEDPAALAQEMNLGYVAETRTRKVLVHANAEDLERS